MCIRDSITYRIFPDGGQCLFTGAASHIPSRGGYQKTALPVFCGHCSVLCGILLFPGVLCCILSFRCLLSLRGYICQPCLIIRYLNASDACLRSMITSGDVYKRQALTAPEMIRNRRGLFVSPTARRIAAP